MKMYRYELSAHWNQVDCLKTFTLFVYCYCCCCCHRRFYMCSAAWNRWVLPYCLTYMGSSAIFMGFFFFIIFKHFMCTTNHTTHKQSRRDSWNINVRNNNVIQCSIQIYAFFIHVTHVLYRFALMLIDSCE